MRCEDARERAELCYDQLLEPAEAREVDTHLRSCAECRAFGERENVGYVEWSN